MTENNDLKTNPLTTKGSKKDEVIADLAEQLAALKAELEEMKHPKTISSPESRATDSSDEAAEAARWMNEYIELKLFKDNDKYSGDVYAACNGRVTIIQRGVWVRVRRYISMIIDQSEIQDMLTAEMVQNKEQLYLRKQAAFEAGLDPTTIV